MSKTCKFWHQESFTSGCKYKSKVETENNFQLLKINLTLEGKVIDMGNPITIN